MSNLEKFVDAQFGQLGRFKSFFEDDDIFFKNFFDKNSLFLPAINVQVGYPVDVYQTENEIVFEVAAAGLDKEDIEISECDNVLTVSYTKENQKDSEDIHYISRGIAKRSFSLGWKLNDKFDLNKIEASLEKGILRIKVPKVTEEKKITKNKVNIK